MKETVVERFLYAQVKMYGGECYKLTPPPAGVQDRLVLLPGGFIAFVETKRPIGGKISAVQAYRAEETIKLGQRHYTINSKWGVESLINDWFKEFNKGKRNEQ